MAAEAETVATSKPWTAEPEMAVATEEVWQVVGRPCTLQHILERQARHTRRAGVGDLGSDADSFDDAEEGYDDSGGAAEAAPEAAVKDQPWTAEAVPAVVRAQGGGAAKAEAAVAGTAQPCAAEAVAASSSGRFWRHRQWALLE